MTILAMESSSLVAATAVSRDGVIVAEYSTNFKKTHSQTLLPMIDEMLKMTGIKTSEIDYVAATNGPGSFTGLRIAAATAKGLCLALGKDVIGLPTLDAFACNYYGSQGLIVPIMDARRGQVYSGIYSFENVKDEDMVNPTEGNTFSLVKGAPYYLEELIEKIAEKINEVGVKKITLLGDANLEKIAEEITEKVKASGAVVTVAPTHLRFQKASSLCFLAEKYVAAGAITKADDFAPVYMRASYAEKDNYKVVVPAKKA